LLVALLILLALATPEPAASVAARAGATCQRGCIVAPGIVYEVTRVDVIILARAVNCEVGSVLETEDAAGAVWALASNWVRRNMLGRVESFGAFVAAYSACTGRKWSSAGWARNRRITPRADANRRLTWSEIPRRSREYALAFLRNEIPNPLPGVVYVLTAGFQRHADPSWVGPYTAPTRGAGSYNLYWKDPATVEWGTETVRIVPATGG